jgi:hypothetical protein
VLLAVQYLILFGFADRFSCLNLPISRFTSLCYVLVSCYTLTIPQARGLVFKDDPNELNETFETPLMAAAANGASESDIRFFVQVPQLILFPSYYVF